MLGHRSHSDVVSARVMIGQGSLGVDEVVFVCLIVFFFFLVNNDTAQKQ